MFAARRLGLLACALLTAPLSGIGCSGDDTPPPADPTYENVEPIIRTSCAFSSSCHGGMGNGQSMLNFGRHLTAGEPFTMALFDGMNNRPACQYDMMPLIEPGDPDNSWLMVKIDGMHDMGTIVFMPDASWDPGIMRDAMGNYPASTCPLTEAGEITFGRNMPWSAGMPLPLPENEVALIRAWIEAGAPGPSGG
jgi:hypothetical protein